MESLAAQLQKRKTDRLFEDAAFVRDFADESQRLEAAKRLICDANIAMAIGLLSEEERQHLIEILAFALPPPETFAASAEMPSDLA
jgi:hypothetical protein